MKRITDRILYIFIIMLFVLTSTAVWAQPTTDPTGDPDATPGTELVPVDGGISILLGAGIAYGVKKMAKKKTM
jgi:hypothetical protein